MTSPLAEVTPEAVARLRSAQRHVSRSGMDLTYHARIQLAYHASLPVAVDSGLLHLLRVNFLPELPYEAEAELLLSPLFDDLGDGLYEIKPDLRNLLLVGLTSEFGWYRTRQTAILLEKYTDRATSWHAVPELEHAQRLTALHVLNHREAREWLATTATTKPMTLGRSWFVAMHRQLASMPGSTATLNDVLREMIDRLDHATTSERLGAIRAIEALAALPGVDVGLAVDALRRAASASDLSEAPTAASALEATLRALQLEVVPIFFLSYARHQDRVKGLTPEVSSPDSHVLTFFHDLCGHVRQLVGLRTGDDAGFIDQSMAAEDQWDPRRLHALRNIPVFVALLSPSYVQSPWCGLEWDAFSRRHPVRTDGSESAEETTILPVIWSPIPPARMPSAVRAVRRFAPGIQADIELRKAYLRHGVYGLLAMNSQHYPAVVWHLARLISNLFHAFRVPPGDPFSRDQLRNAFERTA